MTQWLSNLLLGHELIYELRKRKVSVVSDEEMIRFILMDFIIKTDSNTIITREITQAKANEFAKVLKNGR